jgi:hypothetical protein
MLRSSIHPVHSLRQSTQVPNPGASSPARSLRNLPCRALRRCKLVRYPRQEGDHHAQRPASITATPVRTQQNQLYHGRRTATIREEGTEEAAGGPNFNKNRG